jgi:hypothetical protein
VLAPAREKSNDRVTMSLPTMTPPHIHTPTSG